MSLKYDDSTRKWFEKNLFTQTTVARCAMCGMFYKPSLGHKCKRKSERRIGGNDG